MTSEQFETEYNKIFERAMMLSDKTRREGLLSLDDCIDEELLRQRDIMELGLRLTYDGTDLTIIDNILTNIINQETDKEKKLLKTVQKNAVLMIHQGYSRGIFALSLNSNVNVGYDNALNLYLDTNTFTKASSEDESENFNVSDYVNICAKTQLKAISVLHEKFVRLAAKSLSAKLNRNVSMSVASVGEYTLEEFIRAIPDTAVIGIISMRPLVGFAAMEIYSNIVFDGIFELLLVNLRETWSGIIDLQPKLVRKETIPDSISISKRCEGVVLLTFETRIDEKEAMINLAIPCSSLVPVLNEFTEEKYEKMEIEFNVLKAEEYRKAAENGDAKAQFEIAWCYKAGKGVEKDYAKSAEWFQKSADQGNTDALRNLGICYKNGTGVEEDKTKAVEMYRKALDSMSKEKAESSDAAIIYFDIGSCFNELKEYQYALENSNKALIILKDHYEDDFPLAGEIHNSLGVSYYFLEQYETAIEHFKKSITINEAFLGNENPGGASYNISIAGCYELMSDYDNALIYYNNALNIYKNMYGEEDYNTAIAYFFIADCYYNKEDYIKALDNDLKTLNIRIKICEENAPDLSTSYNNVGSNFYKLGKYNEALEHHLKALELRKKYCDNKEYIAFSYNKTGIDYEELGDMKNAALHYNEALKIYQTLEGLDDITENVRQSLRRVNNEQ